MASYSGVWALATNQLAASEFATCSSNISHLQLFLQFAAATCSNINHLQLFLQLAMANSSNINHLQQCARVLRDRGLRDSPLISKFYLFQFLSQTGVNSMCPEFSKPNEIFFFKFYIGFNIKCSFILLKRPQNKPLVNTVFFSFYYNSLFMT